ncbi:MAG: PilZ domain-containing protein [Thermochromatium sp.]
MTQPESTSIAVERRTQARIELQIPVTLTIPGQETPVRAVTRDLSWGGALLHLTEPLPEDVKILVLSLPWRGGKSIRAQAQVLRIRPHDGGGYLVALRFVSLSPRSQSRLERLLKLLYAAESKDGTQPLFRELEVMVSNTDELRETLLQILEGRYTVTVFEAYQVGQSISLSITGTFDLPSIRLRARVSDVRKSEAKGFDWAELYTLSLEFEHPRSTISAFVDLVLNRLSDVGDENSSFSYLEGAPSWLMSVAAAMTHPGTSLDSTPASRQESARSHLESEYPDAITRLIAGWGHPEDFDRVFSSLVLDQNALPDGWSPEAWEELQLLQDIHDLAYGISSRRQSLFKGR